MAKKDSTFMLLILGAFALAGVIALATCATQPRKGTGPIGSEAPPTASKTPVTAEPKNPTPATGADEQLKGIFADLIKKFEQHQAISASLKTALAVAAQGPGATEGEGAYEYKIRDGKRLIRVYLSNSLSLLATDTTYVSAEIIDDVFDGEYLYKQLQQHRLKQVTKKVYKPSMILQVGGHDAIDPLIDGYSLKLLGEETIHDAPVYVVEATSIGGSGTAKHYFDKTTGIRVKLSEFDADGKLKVDIELSDIKLNPEFGEDHFKAKVHPGFKLIDETQPAGPQP